MAGPATHIQYTSDDGTTYRVRMDTGNAAAAGNVAATSTVHVPSGYVCRYVLATHPTTGRERKIIIGDPTNALWVGGTSTITLEEYSGTHSTAAAHAVLSRVGEKRYNRG
jgi:hypothetical protein